MPTFTISSKGQITLPARLRQKLGLKPKDRVTIEATNDTLVIRRVPDLLEFSGFLGKALPPDRERELMMEGVARHVLGED